MVKVLLINQERIPHYRVPVYNYLGQYLWERGFRITVTSGGVQDGCTYPIRFDYEPITLSLRNLAELITRLNPAAVIFWVNLRNVYLFPILLYTKITGRKAIYWGHGRDLGDRNARLKNAAYTAEHFFCDAIILYAEHLRKLVSPSFHHKVFVANNTLHLPFHDFSSVSKQEILSKYGIATRKNIIFAGRAQRRKRLDHLVRAFKLIADPEIGLILIGPDTDGVLAGFSGANLYKLGPVYGDDLLALLSAAEVYCLPGDVGLSIVDAFHCGLPVVTEGGDRSPEFMYLRDGINGFAVPEGDIRQLAIKLKVLLDNAKLRTKFAHAARQEMMTCGHIDTMCEGFGEALRFVCHGS